MRSAPLSLGLCLFPNSYIYSASRPDKVSFVCLHSVICCMVRFYRDLFIDCSVCSQTPPRPAPEDSTRPEVLRYPSASSRGPYVPILAVISLSNSNVENMLEKAIVEPASGRVTLSRLFTVP